MTQEAKIDGFLRLIFFAQNAVKRAVYIGLYKGLYKALYIGYIAGVGSFFISPKKIGDTSAILCVQILHLKFTSFYKYKLKNFPYSENFAL